MYVIQRLERETGRDYALRVLKENIIRLELKPGSMLSEKEIADELGLSRTPVREALIELSKSQIVEIFPQRGSMVSLIDYGLVEEAYFVRLVMEQAIVELACALANKEDLAHLEENILLQEFYLNNGQPFKLLELDNLFHMQLFKLCNKLQSYYMVKSMSIHFDRVRRMSLGSVKDIKLVGDHREIMNAIRDRNPNAAKQLMAKHLSRYKIDEEAVRKRYPEYIK